MAILTSADLTSLIPSAYTVEKAPYLTDKYMVVSTPDIITSFQENGWYPVRAYQDYRRDPEKGKFAPHHIRFRSKDHTDNTPTVGDLIPEIQITNSYDGYSSLRINAGIFRLACSNGLVVPVEKGSAIVSKIRHMDYNKETVQSALAQINSVSADAFVQLAELRMLNLSESQRIEFAREAARIRFETSMVDVDLNKLLEPVREEDMSDDLFTVMNRIQEKFVHGGVVTTSKAKGRIHTSKYMKNHTTQLETNIMLWDLMMQFPETGTFSYDLLVEKKQEEAA